MGRFRHVTCVHRMKINGLSVCASLPGIQYCLLFIWVRNSISHVKGRTRAEFENRVLRKILGSK
jgi:hypothetical protein